MPLATSHHSEVTIRVMKMLMALLMLVAATAGGGAWAGRLVIPSPENISLQAIPVCYDFGCKNQATVSLPHVEWQSVAGWFVPAAHTPAAEREQIKNAIGWMEVLIGRYTPTHKDLAFDLPPSGDAVGIFPGQLDCIDEAVNTTSYLKLFEMNGLLKHHEVLKAAYRRSWMDQHWAGQVREKQSGTRFVIDSWFQPNGYLPVVQNSEEWEDISPLTAVVDNSRGQADEPVKRSFWRRWLRGE